MRTGKTSNLEIKIRIKRNNYGICGHNGGVYTSRSVGSDVAYKIHSFVDLFIDETVEMLKDDFLFNILPYENLS